MFLPILLKYIYKEGRELKFIIITFIAIFIIMDIVMIFGSSVVKKIQKRKRRKAFSKKMKNLEIKWNILIYIDIFKNCLTKNFIWGGTWKKKSYIFTI